jgi:hypothetical protein
VYYVGAYLDNAAQQKLLEHIVESANVTTIATPPGIEMSRRVQPGGDEVYIVINHTTTECIFQLPWPAFEHLSGMTITADFKLAAHAVAVVTPWKE